MRGISAAAMLSVALVAWPRAGALAVAESYVTVIDTDRRPVLGLSAEDFALRDGGVRQPVLDVWSATAPLSVAVVVLGFDTADRAQVSGALDAVVRVLEAANPANSVRVTPPASGTDRPVVDAIVGACQLLRTAPTDRRVVLAILRRRAGDGVVVEPVRLTDAVLAGRIALWTIEVGPSQTTALDTVLDDAASAGGALRETVSATSALGVATSRVASLLTSQYVVSYTWPHPMLSQINITIRHDRGVVLAPAWQR